MKVLDVLRDVATRLDQAGVASASVDAERLVSHVVGISRGELLAKAHTGFTLEAPALEELELLVSRRSRREPLQHLIGTAAFLGFEVAVGPGVFVPRPETESMAERAIHHAQTMAVGAHGLRILDLCAGSGVLGIALARSVPHAHVSAVEVSDLAYPYLEKNTQELAPEITVVQADLVAYGATLADESVDMIVANPPYIPDSEVPNDPEVADFDPGLALYGGIDGLDVVRDVLELAKRVLRPGGLVMIEHSNLQGLAVRQLCEEAGFRAITTEQDLVGRDRFTQGFRS